MGIDTKILLTGKAGEGPPSALDLLQFAVEHYKKASLGYTPILPGEGLYWLRFDDGKDARMLSVDYADVCSRPAVFMSMGLWGNSEAIARRFAIHFGGLVLVNDCAGNWETP